jgi:hypothetical protein
MTARLSAVVLEAPEPHALAEFYAEVLETPISRVAKDEQGTVVWVDVGEPSGVRLSVQRAPGHERPAWPDPTSSMQIHLDILVDDIEAAERRALAAGAVRLPWGSAEEEEQRLREPGEGNFRVYTDPAGHPFCLEWH